MHTIRQRDAAVRERRFRRLLATLGKRPGALIPLLQQAQGIFGFLPAAAMRRIARARRISAAEVYGVATFYGQFRLKPAGRHLLTVCHGTACHVAGAEKISEAVVRLLGVKAGETTPDGRLTVRDAACLGCCSLSPVVMLDDAVHGKLSPAKLPALIEKCR